MKLDLDWDVRQAIRRQRTFLLMFAGLFVLGVVAALTDRPLAALVLILASVLGSVGRVLTGMLPASSG